ncbi:helix-turn-helix transcriptional regulator [Marinihelvus fidelis]|uniref:Helix-turn-helix transcriptional regulator n=1 Tax=Marinihelvus fidelis TaxID=2613842 RepID=A0A5N0TDS0_9GAMM|nr:metalloregulator ArsR/SmtB family transcription factor [Marinihelvus fidelis]KAA9133243.1 helix-turn-helix transcriptional regulator [Marinihelvus fidelis]
MEINEATRAFSALAQDSRLAAFRRLVQAGPEGLPSGDLARELGVPANTLSTHLSILANAGLVSSRREGRNVFYQADFQGVRRMLDYLLEDCCQGAPEVCGPLLDRLQSPS